LMLAVRIAFALAGVENRPAASPWPRQVHPGCEFADGRRAFLVSEGRNSL
jgi:hypothetical protein